jgi:hypothetical protein
MNLILAAASFIVLHNVDGDELFINVDQIVMLQNTRESKGATNTLIAGGHKCVIAFANGKFVSVVEDCGMIRQSIKQELQPR